MRRSLVVILLLTGCAPIQRLVERGDPSERLAAGVTIMRDEWGVPHVFGESDAHVAFGAGYVQAEDEFRRLEDTYLIALGRASHWYGSRYLAGDLLAAAFEVERLAREEYEREPPDRRAFWDAFAEGINWWIRTSGEQPRLITRFEGWMPFAVARMIDPRSVVDGVPLDTIVALAGTDMDATAPDSGRAPSAMAVSPSRTADGDALLLHVGRGAFFDDEVEYEIMLASGSGWRARGFTRLGLPLPYAGHNGGIAWARTPTTMDVADAYVVVMDADMTYASHGERHTARAWQDTLQVNSPTGVRPLAVSLRSTRHGPVVAGGDTAIAVRIADMNEGGSLQQLYAFVRARSLEEFRIALATHRAAANTVYADTAGNIMAVHGGAVPARDTAVDWSRPVDAAAAHTEWRGLVPVEQLSVINPSSGIVTSEPEAAFVPPAAGGFSFEALAALAFDARVHDIDEDIAALASEWERVGGFDATRARRLDEAVELLRSWDAVASPGSTEATLYILWQERMRNAGYIDEYARFRALEDVIARFDAGDDGVPAWGDVNRLQRPASALRFSDEQPSEATGGAPWWTGAAFELTTEPGPGPLRRYAVSGVTSVLAVRLGAPVESRSVVMFGQSADTSSAHRFDQAALYVTGRLKPAPLAEQAVQSSARRVYRPGER